MYAVCFSFGFVLPTYFPTGARFYFVSCTAENSLIHQFCTVGEHSFTSFASHVNQSIPPYVTVAGEKARVKGINSEGLKRRGFSAEQINQVRRAYKALYRESLTLEDATTKITEMATEHPEIDLMVNFLNLAERGIIR